METVYQNPNTDSNRPYETDAPSHDEQHMRALFREEAERAAITHDVRSWGDKAFIFGILSIVFIAVGAGLVAIALAFYCAGKSNRAADSIGIPRDAKAKRGRILACVPLIIGAAAGLTVGFLALCGVL